MIGQLIAVALTVLIGSAVSRALRLRGGAGLSYLYGIGAFAVVSPFVPWTRWTVAAILIAALAACLASRRADGAENPLRLSSVDAVTAIVLACFASFATIAQMWEWDAWAIWALKARVFLEHRGVDWAFLQAPANAFVHADYPLLVPGALAWPSLITGVWDDRWIGVVTVAFLAAGVVTIRRITAAEFSPALSASIALAVAGIGASTYVSTAETPVIAISVCALACVRAGEWREAAVLLGLAAITKNEGLALLAAVCAVLFVMRRARDVMRLWPSLVIVAPWMLARAVHGLNNDLTSAAISGRAAMHAADAGRIARLLVANTEAPWLWLMLMAGGFLAWRRERLLLAIVLVQLLFSVAVYFITPYDVAWHIANSWNRVARQLTAMAAVGVLAGLAGLIEGRRQTSQTADAQSGS